MKEEWGKCLERSRIGKRRENFDSNEFFDFSFFRGLIVFKSFNYLWYFVMLLIFLFFF